MIKRTKPVHKSAVKIMTVEYKHEKIIDGSEETPACPQGHPIDPSKDDFCELSVNLVEKSLFFTPDKVLLDTQLQQRWNLLANTEERCLNRKCPLRAVVSVEFADGYQPTGRSKLSYW